MDKEFNYSFLFDQALEKIKSIRDPRATRADTIDLRWKDIENNVIFNFIDCDLRKQFNVSESANNISISCLCFIIKQLLREYHYSIQEVNIENEKGFAKARLGLIDEDNKVLLLFKEIEDSAVFKNISREPKEIRDIMDKYGAIKCQYIYLLYDNAYLQVIGHNDDEKDPGRGYNLYSLKWFFTEYFSEEEYFRFESSLKTYIEDVKNCIGYRTVKTLTPNSLINFKKITENELLSYPYDILVGQSVKNYKLDIGEYNKIKSQFYDSKTYLGLIGKNDFAESLVTAEWLFDSMKKAQAIDLTIIGMGYFKAVEQLMYELICLHNNEHRTIKKDYSRKDLPNDRVELNQKNIDDKAIDFTIGSMAMFYKDNLDIFRNDLSYKTRKYVLETIFRYKDIRNGYFHKDNIHDLSTIDYIRNATFELFFLLLGSKTLTIENKNQLGYIFLESSDYYKLCEYVNYHFQDIFYLDLGREEEEIAFGYYDPHSRMVENKYLGYSGVYFKELGKDGRVVGFRKEHLPKKISLGKFVYGFSDKVDIHPVKIKTVFENGKFVGPSIADEEKMNY